MKLLTNFYVFPIFQTAIFLLFFWVAFRDYKIKRPAASAKLTVTRGDKSMGVLEKVSGLVLAAIVTIVNGAVFAYTAFWANYSALFNVVDISIIIYLWYFSPWGRNFILGVAARAKRD